MASDFIWMCRAGKGAEWIDDFLDKGIVGIGFGVPSIDPSLDKAEIERAITRVNPNGKPGSIAVAASQVKRFHSELSVGDTVATYDPSRRLYFLGEVLSESEYDADLELAIKRVRWNSKVPRETLATPTRNTLGAILTLFLVQDAEADDLRRNAAPIDADLAEKTQPETQPDRERETAEESIVLEEVVAKAKEFLEDRIVKLDWEQMQELVAEILRAMGYKARVSPKGSDRGVDVIASPDGLGLQEPRIFVEVKHRPGTTISADQIRSFIGGRQAGDRCLYVSTGGFTKDARYEAERSSIPITLISMPELRELLTEYYDRLSPNGIALVPLTRIYWPES